MTQCHLLLSLFIFQLLFHPLILVKLLNCIDQTLGSVQISHDQKGGRGVSQFSCKILQGGQGFEKFSRAINVQILCTFEKLFSLKILVILAIKLYLLKPFPSLSIQGTIHNLNHTNLGLFRAPFPDLTSPLVRVWFSLYLLEQVMLVYIQEQIHTQAIK